MRWIAGAAAGLSPILWGAACVGYLDANTDALRAADASEGGVPAGSDGGPGGGDGATGGTDSGGLADASTDAGCGYGCVIQKDKPILYLRLGEEVSAPKAIDSSGNGRDGTYPLAGITKGVDGIDPGDHAVRFSGTGPQAITMPSSVDFPQGSGVAFAIELWLKPENITGMRFILDHQEFTNRGGWIVRMEDGEIGLELWNNDAVFGVAYSSTPLTAGAWHHVVFDYSYADRRAFVFVDGELKFSQVLGASGSLPVIGTWSIGKQNCSPCADVSYIGSLDEIAIYDRPLDEPTVKAHYAAAKSK